MMFLRLFVVVWIYTEALDLDPSWIPKVPLSDKEKYCEMECFAQDRFCSTPTQYDPPNSCRCFIFKHKEPFSQKLYDCLHRRQSDYFERRQQRYNLFNNNCGIGIDALSQSEGNAFKMNDAMEAENLRFPWAVAVTASFMKEMPDGSTLKMNSSLGSGVLIDSKTLLTAKHVIDFNPTAHDFMIFGGDVDMGVSYRKGQWAMPAKFTFHPTLDLAIVTMDREIQNTKPVCMPLASDSPRHPQPLRFAGFGRSSEGPQSKLHYGDFEYMFRWRRTIVDNVTYEIHCDDDQDMICSRENRNYQICSGDSGVGWLFSKYPDPEFPQARRWYLMGIANHGLYILQNGEEECNGKPTEGAFVNVHKARGWICNHTVNIC